MLHAHDFRHEGPVRATLTVKRPALFKTVVRPREDKEATLDKGKMRKKLPGTAHVFQLAWD